MYTRTGSGRSSCSHDGIQSIGPCDTRKIEAWKAEFQRTQRVRQAVEALNVPHPTFVDRTGWTPLHTAANEGDIKVRKWNEMRGERSLTAVRRTFEFCWTRME